MKCALSTFFCPSIDQETETDTKKTGKYKLRNQTRNALTLITLVYQKIKNNIQLYCIRFCPPLLNAITWHYY